MSTVAMYGGGFKPPTKGHFYVVSEAIKTNPEIDEFKIFVGGKERNGITQSESLEIWDIYKKYLPEGNINIIPSKKGPIGEIISYAKGNPDDKVLFVIGAREGNQEDFDDVESRTSKSLLKYPNIELVLITTKDQSISGTNARNAAKINKEKLIKYLPDQLNSVEINKIFDMLKSTINENITRSQLNDIEKYADNLFNKLGIDIEFTRHFLERANDMRNRKPISTAELIGLFKRLYKKHGKPLSKTDTDWEAVVKDFNSNLNIPFAIKVTDDDIEMYAKTVMRKKDFKTYEPVLALTEGRYDSEVLKLSRSIINALKERMGTRFSIKYKEQFEDVDYDLNLLFKPSDADYPYLIDASSGYDELNIDIEYNPKYFPAEYNELIAELKEVLRHEFEHIAQFNFFKDSYPEGSSDDLPMFDYLMLDYEVAAGVQGLYKRSKTTKQSFTQVLDDFLDERSDELTPKEIKKVKQTYIDYAKKNLPKVVLNENATYTKQIDLIQRLAELTQNMLDNGDNIEPLPELEFVNGDNENASEFLGKTAYYDPATTTIVLYTEGRHPKDIARSYAHEMVHHTQHLEGRLDGITTTDTNEDDNLKDIEKEAYLEGNIKFRNWTDSLSDDVREMISQSDVELDENIFKGALDRAKNISKKIKGGVKDQAQDFKNLGPLLKKWKNKDITDSEKKKLKSLLVDVAKALGIVITYPVLGITVNALLSMLIKKLSKGKLKGTLPSKIAAVLHESLSDK